MKKVFIGLAILFAASIVALHIIVSCASRDIPEPDVSDLLVDRPGVAAESNAFTFFESAANSLYWPTNALDVIDFLGGATVDVDVVTEVIEQNAEMMGKVSKGILCSICLAPEVTSFDDRMPYISQWRNMGRVLAIKARSDRIAGNFGDAVITTVSILRFADLIQRNAEGVINYLVSIAIMNLGLDQAMDIAQDERFSQDDLSMLSEALAAIGPFDVGFRRAIKVEYKAVAKALDDITTGKYSMADLTSIDGSGVPAVLKGKRIGGYMYQPNKSKLTFATLYRDMISNASLPYGEINFYDVEDVLDLKGSKFKLITRPNGVGKILYGLLMPALDAIIERKCRVECSVAATHLVTTIMAYEKKNGKMPDKLDELVPDFITMVPMDPYDGKPFRYNASKRIVYSVGKDLEDSGGSSGKLSEEKKYSNDHWDDADIVFPLMKESE